ncbi:probable acyl-CoA dehydrogenase 6 [Nematostella vectensis]|uniref:probable acyl-CoA dehydrogenase 6 n=1 Tax=Nematostella vectensis TaxID=45351 RepID=UPI002076D9E9|nr:probable acyl-CoA dehydrogenase 6 [Nematostella vectensis]
MAASRLLLCCRRKAFSSSVRFFSSESTAKSAASLRPDPYHYSHESIFTDDHVQLRENLNKFIEKEINPFVDEWEKAKMFPAHELFKKFGKAGYFGVNKPVKYGGMGLDYSFSVAMAEELGSIKCGGVPMAIGVQADMATPALVRFGSEELKQQFLVPTIAGDFVTCLGVSETGAGSDVASIKTTAVKDGDDYVINGGKMWTTNGIQADWMCLLANTDKGHPHFNKTLICLPLNLPGIQRTRNIDKLGMHCSDTAEFYFENVRVPQSYRIGEEGMGFVYQMLQFVEERVFAGASVLVSLERLIKETAEYCKGRTAFGKSILDNQYVHYRLAELQTEVELLRSLVYRTTDLHIKKKDSNLLASMLKLKAGRLVREVTDSCLQFWGGMGFTSDVEVSRAYRDNRLLSIGGGADEVMLSIICKEMNLLPQEKKKK